MPEDPKLSLRDSVARQRAELKQILAEPLSAAAEACRDAWGSRDGLNAVLACLLPTLPYCRYLYALDTAGLQVSDNLGHEGVVADDFGRDRSQRPYMREVQPGAGFLLSRSYITLRERRPGLTAIQLVRDRQGRALGFVAADFYLQELPLTKDDFAAHFAEQRQWKQLRGDPSIRSTVFHQTRTESELDRHIDTALGIVAELIGEHGLHHIMLHFSSSRAVYWTIEDPLRYRLFGIKALTDPDTCLAFRKHAYPGDALVPRERIRAILDGMRNLRFVDDTFYLRSGTLNIFNGLVGLTFSCDGSHYVPWDEFLKMDVTFWLGTTA